MKPTLKTLFDEYFQGEEDFKIFMCVDVRDMIIKGYFDGREVFIAQKMLKGYLAFLNFVVTKNLEISKDVVYSYRKDLNIADAVRMHARSRHFYQTDLKDFFHSVDISLIKEAMLRSRELMPFADPNDHVERIAQLTTVNGKLPPGFATSPAISNAVLFEFDELFLNYCRERDLIFTRYSDDIIVSGTDKDTVATAAKAIRTFFFDTYGRTFAFNPEKTKFVHTGRKIKLLGMNILPNGLVAVDKKIRNKVETLLHNYSTNTLKFIALTKNQPEKGIESISGHLNFIRCVDEGYLLKLKEKYGASFIDGFLKKDVPLFLVD